MMRAIGFGLSLVVGGLNSGMAAAGTLTATDLYEAMEVDSADVLSSSITSSVGSYDVIADLGVFLPEMGSDMSILHTGRVGTSPEPGVDILQAVRSGIEARSIWS